ncbi:MAG: hypothetical protein ACPL88_11410, partial [Bryobacteraceae bacterium]
MDRPSARRIFLKLLAATFGLLAATFFISDLLVCRVAQGSYVASLERELQTRLRILLAVSSNGLGQVGQQEFKRFASAAGGRLTWVAADGRILLDSEADASRMNNHGSRPEVARALSGQTGVAIRRSPTVGVDFLYVAVPSGSGALRLAVPLVEVRAAVLRLLRQMLVSAGIAFIPAILLAALLSRYVSRR